MTPAVLPLARRAPLGERQWMAVVLLVGLLHGLIYVFLVPPWQHYDEPSHFEFAWMILEARSIPKIGAYDNNIRRELVKSMITYGFFRNLGDPPELDAQNGPIWIGVSKTGVAPLYYITMDVPLALFSWANVTIRLYAVRLTSLALFVLVLWFAYQLISELTPPGHPLRWTVPASLALLPALTDIMTAFNDDVGAVFIFSLFIWAAVRLLMRGATVQRVLAVCALAVLCALTKNTVLMAIPLSLVAVALVLVPRRWLKAAVVALALLAVAGFLSVIGWGDAADWYPSVSQAVPTRAERPEAPWGHRALDLFYAPGQPRMQFRQLMLASDASALDDTPVTLGAWIWASTPGIANLPRLSGSPLMTVTVSTVPLFYATTVTLTTSAGRAAVDILMPANVSPLAERSIYYDGLVLAEGTYPASSPPVLASNAAAGTWDGRTFINRARNASFEQGAPRVRPWAEALFSRTAAYYFSLSRLVVSLYDIAITGPVLYQTSHLLLESFWARFSWAQIGLPPIGYRVLGVATLLGVVAGIGRGLWIVRQQTLAWKMAVTWLALTTLSIWLTILLRGLFTITDDRIVLPVSRYAFPAVIPSMLLLVLGWRTCLRWWRSWRVAVPLGLFLVLDLVSLVTIYQYYL